MKQQDTSKITKTQHFRTKDCFNLRSMYDDFYHFSCKNCNWDLTTTEGKKLHVFKVGVFCLVIMSVLLVNMARDITNSISSQNHIYQTRCDTIMNLQYYDMLVGEFDEVMYNIIYCTSCSERKHSGSNTSCDDLVSGCFSNYREHRIKLSSEYTHICEHSKMLSRNISSRPCCVPESEASDSQQDIEDVFSENDNKTKYCSSVNASCLLESLTQNVDPDHTLYKHTIFSDEQYYIASEYYKIKYIEDLYSTFQVLVLYNYSVEKLKIFNITLDRNQVNDNYLNISSYEDHASSTRNKNGTELLNLTESQRKKTYEDTVAFYFQIKQVFIESMLILTDHTLPYMYYHTNKCQNVHTKRQEFQKYLRDILEDLQSDSNVDVEDFKTRITLLTSETTKCDYQYYTYNLEVLQQKLLSYYKDLSIRIISTLLALLSIPVIILSFRQFTAWLNIYTIRIQSYTDALEVTGRKLVQEKAITENLLYQMLPKVV